MTEIRDRLRQMLGEHLGVPPAEIGEDVPLFVNRADQPADARFAPPGLPGDSLDRVEFALAVEEAFEVSIPEAEEAQVLATINTAAVWLDARVGDASAEMPA